MGQIERKRDRSGDFFRSLFSSKNGFVPFGTNLTHFGPKYSHPVGVTKMLGLNVICVTKVLVINREKQKIMSANVQISRSVHQMTIDWPGKYHYLQFCIMSAVIIKIQQNM